MYKIAATEALVIGVVLAVGASSVGAEDVTLFSCSTRSGKVIELVDAGKTINYSYGKPGQPEIALRVPRASTSTEQWSGMGSSESYVVEVPNGDTIYSVYSTLDHGEGNLHAGVIVTVNGKQVADVRCADTAKMVDNLMGVDLPASSD